MCGSPKQQAWFPDAVTIACNPTSTNTAPGVRPRGRRCHPRNDVSCCYFEPEIGNGTDSRQATARFTANTFLHDLRGGFHACKPPSGSGVVRTACRAARVAAALARASTTAYDDRRAMALTTPSDRLVQSIVRSSTAIPTSLSRAASPPVAPAVARSNSIRTPRRYDHRCRRGPRWSRGPPRGTTHPSASTPRTAGRAS